MEQQEDALHYGRISNKKQNDGFSLDAQERLGQDYADRRNLRIVKTWRVIESAWNKKKDRVAFNQVIEFAIAHPKIKHIIFDITDRMTRNDIDKIKINDLIHNHGKIIHFACCRYTCYTPPHTLWHQDFGNIGASCIFPRRE